MVKRWLTPQLWRTRISTRIFFFKDSTCAWSKDDWPPRYDRPRSHLEFFLMIQHVHGQKMINPPGMTDRISTRIFFFKDSTCAWSNDDWPPQLWQTWISPRIFFKDSTCAWSKDDWPPRYDRPGSHLEFSSKDSTCAWSKDDWPPRYDRPGSHLEFF